ncbi:glycosyltransferase family 4 protein [Symbiobacterium thermophilum]|uniref:Putative glycosyl transferase n=1 Tax=Symbiobacterium thermophilum (strain DSM 24528 / JCM 14929 / IAM 14863 / T) TaxID=292459 RepID=Q67KU9_SYMTH|nr:putative glycosyl transferase [Symbiobacterium thermophilum IAM 14863]
MRILYVITLAEKGGAQVHLLDLLRNFSRTAEVHLAVGERGFLTDEAARLGIPIHLIEGLVRPVNPAKDFLAARALVRLLRRIRPDLLHAHSSKAGQVGRLAARLAGVPAVYTVHGWAFADGVPLWRRCVALPAERLAAHWSRYMITVSDADRLLASRYRFPTDRMFVVHNGVPDVVQRAQVGRADLPPHIVMVARFAPQKDQALLLKALSRVNVPFTLSFVGEGETQREHRQLAHQLGMMDRVRFLGSRHDIADILADAQIFVLTSNWEGFPITILEAMRAGLPVIASDVGGVREAVLHGRTGYLVARGDVDALQRYLTTLLTDPQLREKLGNEARKTYEQRFTLDRMLDQTRRIYELIIS